MLVKQIFRILSLDTYSFLCEKNVFISKHRTRKRHELTTFLYAHLNHALIATLSISIDCICYNYPKSSLYPSSPSCSLAYNNGISAWQTLSPSLNLTFYIWSILAIMLSMLSTVTFPPTIFFILS